MAATSTITSRGASGNIDDEVLARLRTALVADRAPQAALVRANEATAQALTGQRDVDSILEREIAEASAARARDAIEDIDAALCQDGGGYLRRVRILSLADSHRAARSNSPCQVLRQLFDIADRLDLRGTTLLLHRPAGIWKGELVRGIVENC